MDMMIRRIIRFGFSPKISYQEKRAVIISNILALILIASVLFSAIIRVVLFGIPPGFWRVYTIGIVVFILPIVLNRIGRTMLARIILCVIPVVYLWYSYYPFNGDIDGIRPYLLATSFIPYLVFNAKHRIAMICTIAPTFISVFGFEWLLNLQNNVHHYELVDMRYFIAYLILSAGCYSFNRIIFRGDILNKTLIKSLRAKKIQLIMLNENLEDLVDSKTSKIRVQNMKLTHYAFTNAHKFRGPIVRILGLINVFKMDRSINHDWLVNKIEGEMLEIDRITKEIQKTLEELDEND